MEETMPDTHIRIGSCILVKDESTSEIRLANGKAMTLTHPESAILKCLYQNQGQVVAKDDLTVAGWGRPELIGPNSLPVAIANIRKVLSLTELEIVTVPKVGYKFDLPPESPVTPVTKEAPDLTVRSNPRKLHNVKPLAISLCSITIITSTCLLALFAYHSWVRIDCKVVDSIRYCFNEREFFETLAPMTLGVPDKGNLYYFNDSGSWVEVTDSSQQLHEAEYND